MYPKIEKALCGFLGIPRRQAWAHILIIASVLGFGIILIVFLAKGMGQ